MNFSVFVNINPKKLEQALHQESETQFFLSKYTNKTIYWFETLFLLYFWNVAHEAICLFVGWILWMHMILVSYKVGKHNFSSLNIKTSDVYLTKLVPILPFGDFKTYTITESVTVSSWAAFYWIISYNTQYI